MKGLINAGLVGALLFAGVSAHAGDLKPVFPKTAKISNDMAVLYFNSKSRFDLNILAEFIKDCGAQGKVTCICAESSDTSDAELVSTFENTVNEPCLYRGGTDMPVPRMEFIVGGAVKGTIEKNGNFTGETRPYLKYVAGEIDEAGLAGSLKAAEGAEMYKKMVPRMNFVLMLAKKGQPQAALKELDGIEVTKLDDRGKLLLGQTFLRLKAPEKAVSVLEECTDEECIFYLGIAQYLAGKNADAVATFKSLKGKYKDENKLNFYLKKSYEAEGDVKNADEIRLPENYNIDSE